VSISNLKLIEKGARLNFAMGAILCRYATACHQNRLDFACEKMAPTSFILDIEKQSKHADSILKLFPKNQNQYDFVYLEIL